MSHKRPLDTGEEDVEINMLSPRFPRPKSVVQLNKDVCKELETYINNLAGNSLMHVYPTKYLIDICSAGKNETIAASSLRFKEVAAPQHNPHKKTKHTESDKSPPPPQHFNGEFMDDRKWDRSINGIKQYIIERVQSTLSREEDLSVQSFVARTSVSIMDNIGRMKDQEIQNEAELRFCIGDPILCAICDAWGYKARLEESVKDQTAAAQPGSSAAPQQPSSQLASTSPQQPPASPPASTTPQQGASPQPVSSTAPAPQQQPASPLASTSSGLPRSSGATPRGLKLQNEVITGLSRAEYTVYVIQNESQEIISVIIEAKHTSHSLLRHVLAQLIGYFAAFQIAVLTPLAFVLTEQYVQIVVFPFYGSSHLLINAVALPKLNMFTQSGDVNRLPLQLILSLSKSTLLKTQVTLPEGCCTMSKDQLCKNILTEKQKMSQRVEELEIKIAQQQAEHQAAFAEQQVAFAEQQAEQQAAFAEQQAEQQAALVKQQAKIVELEEKLKNRPTQ